MQTDNYNWYALYVKSRHEFTAKNELVKKGIDNYLPVIKKLRRWNDRKKSLEFPLFPGYVFVHIPPYPDEFVKVLKTRGAVTLISMQPCKPTPIPEDEIESLRLLTETGGNIDIYPHLKEGTRVRVRKGPLKGAAGILEMKENQHMFLVNVDLLGRSVGVKVYAEEVEAL